MKKNILIVVLLIAAPYALAQNVKILDAETQNPIPNTAVFNKDKTKAQVSDIAGIVNLAIFNETEEITFKTLGYKTKNSTKAAIAKNNNRILLLPDSQQLDEVVVSASKWEQRKRDIPQKIKTITQSEIRFTNPQTSADLLQSNGNVFVQKSQLGGGSPMIRGFATNRLLITVDGIRMNNAIFRGGNIQNVISIDPLAVKSTEIIFGPGSVIYGSDAIGGTMNFFTLDPIFSTDEKLYFKGSSLARYASANQEKTAHTDVNFGFQKWAFATSISYSDFEDLKMGKHGPDEYLRSEYVRTVNDEDVMVANSDPRVQKPTAYNQVNILQKIKYKPNENWNYTTGIYYSTTSDYSRYDRLTQYNGEELHYAQWYYGPQKWFLGNVQIHHKAQSGFYSAAKFTNAYQHFEESRNERTFQSPLLFTTKEKLNVISSNLDFEKKFDKRYKLFYGLEYIHNKVNSTGNQLNINTGEQTATASRYPNGATWQSLAAYTHMEFKPDHKLTILSGLRYNHIFTYADFTENNVFYNFPFTKARNDTGALTGSAGISWQPNDIFQWKLNLSTAFRAPNIDDIGKIFDSEPGAVVVPNPNLKPEYAYNGELELNLNFNKKVTIGTAVYYTHLTNALIRRPFTFDGESQIMYNGILSDVQAIQNATTARAYGFEAFTKIQLAKYLELSSTINYTGGSETQENGTRAPLRHAPPLFGSTQLTWKSDRLTVAFFANYNGENAFEDLAVSEQNKAHLYATDTNGNPYAPAWHTLNLKTQYCIYTPLTINLGIENITNQRYRTYSSGIAAPGTNVTIGAVYNF